MSCLRCGTDEVKFWSVQREGCYCFDCAVRMHYPGTVDEFDDLEEIADGDEKTVRIITPVLHAIFKFYFFWWFWKQLHVTPTYLHSSNTCPVSDSARIWISQMDPGLFVLAKGPLHQYCNLEDSAWSLVLDVWVRGIVTETDSLFLILSSFIYAWIYYKTISSLIFPLIALKYAILMDACNRLEGLLPPLPPLFALQSVVLKLDILSGSSRRVASLPPDTNPRARPSFDYLDAGKYWFPRLLRHFRHFYVGALGMLNGNFTLPIFGSVAIRIVCLASLRVSTYFGFSCGIGGILSYVAPLGSYIGTHRSWFASYSTDQFSDQLLWFSLSYAYNTFVLSYQDYVAIFISLKFLFLICIVLGAGVGFLFWRHGQLKQQFFEKQWPAIRKEVLNM